MKNDWPAQILDLACRIQQIPGPTFNEGQRAAFLVDQFTGLSSAQPLIDAAGNVWLCVPGGPQPPLVVSAHLDTVFPIETPLTLEHKAGRVIGPAIGDNSLGLAALIGLAGRLKTERVRLPGDCWFIATTGEEGLGNLIGMEAVVNRLGDQPLAYLILEGIGLGNIYHRGLGVERFQILVRTAGGHSWADYGKPSAIHVMADLVHELAGMALPGEPRTSLNVGTFQGGTSVNTIASEAVITVDLRSVDPDVLKKVTRQVLTLAEGIAAPGIEVHITRVGHRPAGEIPVSHPLVQLAAGILTESGISPQPGIASTDANSPLSRGYPAICIGLAGGNYAHTRAETIYTNHLDKGLNCLWTLVRRAWSIRDNQN